MKGRVNHGLIAVLFMFLIVSLISCSSGGSSSSGGGGGNGSTPPLPTYTQKFLFVANHDSGDVYTYSIADDGTLSPVGNRVVAGGSPESITADRLVRFVYVANWDGTINVYSIDAASGVLTEVASSPRTTPPGSVLESVTVARSGGFLYVADRVSGSVYGYSIADDGTLSPVGNPITAGGFPETITADPQGRFVYVANWSSNTISAYKIDNTNGELSSVGEPFATGFSPYSVTVDPSGRFVYVANYGDGNDPSFSSVYAYKIEPGGELTLIDLYAAGTGSNSVTVDPAGKFAYVANHDSDNVSAYKIESSGALTPVAGSPFAAGINPYSVTVDPSGSFVYVANYGDGSISAYLIESNGALTLIGSFTAGTGPVSVTTVGIM